MDKNPTGPVCPDDDDMVAIQIMVTDSIVTGTCTSCGMTYEVEPDARNYDCHEGCGEAGTVTSPLVREGFI